MSVKVAGIVISVFCRKGAGAMDKKNSQRCCSRGRGRESTQEAFSSVYHSVPSVGGISAAIMFGLGNTPTEAAPLFRALRPGRMKMDVSKWATAWHM